MTKKQLRDAINNLQEQLDRTVSEERRAMLKEKLDVLKTERYVMTKLEDDIADIKARLTALEAR